MKTERLRHYQRAVSASVNDVWMLANELDHAQQMIDWLSKHRAHWSQPADDYLVHFSTYKPQVVPLILAAAEKAVREATSDDGG